MDLQLLLYSQIFADFILCFAIIFLLRQLSKKMNVPPPTLPALSDQTIREFKTLLSESQQAANSFLASMEESRNKLREVVRLLDKKEKSCRDIIEQSLDLTESIKNGTHERKPSAVDHQYAELIELSGQGLTVPEIARRTGLAAGEISLVLDLHRTKKEND